MTVVLVALVVVAALAVVASPDPGAMVARLGYRSPFDVWRGAVWSLVVSSLLHQWLWHLAFNPFGIWRLGPPIERVVGSLRMVLLVVGGASVAGATELAVCDSTGMGASGILHALFGFARLAKRKLPQLSLVAGLMGDARLRSRRDGKLRARA